MVLVPALVQGAQAPASLIDALQRLYGLAQEGAGSVAGAPHIDTILLVRGGGSIETSGPSMTSAWPAPSCKARCR